MRYRRRRRVVRHRGYAGRRFGRRVRRIRPGRGGWRM